MISLEKDLEESTTGTPYELLLFIGDRCGVEIAQTEEEILALTNGGHLLSVSIDRIDTFRAFCICSGFLFLFICFEL